MTGTLRAVMMPGEVLVARDIVARGGGTKRDVARAAKEWRILKVEIIPNIKPPLNIGYKLRDPLYFGEKEDWPSWTDPRRYVHVAFKEDEPPGYTA